MPVPLPPLLLRCPRCGWRKVAPEVPDCIPPDAMALRLLRQCPRCGEPLRRTHDLAEGRATDAVRDLLRRLNLR